MKPAAKVAIVVGGYVAAFFVACAVTSAYMAMTASPDRDQYAAMFAFGDSLLFLGAFVVAALPATGAALYFLRPYPPFWRALSGLAAFNAGLAIVSVVTFLLLRGHAAPGSVGIGISLAVLRLLVAPAMAPILLACGVFAPSRSSRVTLFACAAVEIVAFALYLVPMLWHR